MLVLTNFWAKTQKNSAPFGGYAVYLKDKG